MNGRKKPRVPRVTMNPLAPLRPMEPGERDKVMTRYYTALQELAAGRHPGQAEWRDLSDTVNVLATLAQHMGKLDPVEILPIVNAANHALKAAARRFVDGQRLGLDAAGLTAMRAVLDAFEQCLIGFTEREMLAAAAETTRRIREQLRSNPKREVTIL